MNNLKAARIRRGLTQAQLAELAKIHTSTLSTFETGMARPYPAQAARLAAVLQLLPSQLLEDSGEQVEIRSVCRRAM